MNEPCILSDNYAMQSQFTTSMSHAFFQIIMQCNLSLQHHIVIATLFFLFLSAVIGKKFVVRITNCVNCFICQT